MAIAAESRPLIKRLQPPKMASDSAASGLRQVSAAPAPPSGCGAELVVPIGTVYEFTGEDIAVCAAVGAARNAANESAGTTNMNYSGRDDTDISVQGALGELMFCRLFSLPVGALFDTRCRNAGNDTFDATLVGGLSVDVKTARHAVPVMLVGANKRANPADLFALLTLERGSRRGAFVRGEASDAGGPGLSGVFRGMAAGVEVFNFRRKQNWSGKQQYVRRVEDLHAWPEVREHYVDIS